MIKKATLLLFFIIVLVQYSIAQEIKLSPQAEISVITCGPGTELYSTFGHSAFRVKDPVYKHDVVYNYGTFDFNTPNFYLKFAQGKLLYQLSRSRFSTFIRTYQYEKRWVKEQVLNLTPEELRELFNFLEYNAKPENRAYKYDFFFDNCATKITDVTLKIKGSTIKIGEGYVDKVYTFRQLIQKNLNWNSWSSFGIDIALGSKIDKIATAEEYQFLPDYVFKALEHTTINDKPIVKRTTEILKPQENTSSSSILLSPIVVLGLISLIILIITFLDYKKQKRTKWLDISVFLITGLAGLLLLFLWFATDHSMTVNNWNILWAFFPNVIIAYFLGKKETPKWISNYLKLISIFLLILIILWMTGIQIFAKALLPILIALVIRYIYLVYFFKKEKHYKS